MSNQHKHPTISFRVSDSERKRIEARILASGMMKKDYFVRSCIYNRICVVGKKETIYPLVQTVNALYLQLLEMQKHLLIIIKSNIPIIFLQTMKSQSYRPAITICFLPSLTCLMVLSISGKETPAMNNNLIYLFGMYELDTDSIIVYTNDSNPFIINCQKYNSSVILENPDDIVYLYRLAQDTPLLYAELALKSDGLQGYVDAMNEFN